MDISLTPNKIGTFSNVTTGKYLEMLEHHYGLETIQRIQQIFPTLLTNANFVAFCERATNSEDQHIPLSSSDQEYLENLAQYARATLQTETKTRAFQQELFAKIALRGR